MISWNFIHISIGSTYDVMINAICLLLSFSFTKHYYRVICYCCRHCCEIPYLKKNVIDIDIQNRVMAAKTKDFGRDHDYRIDRASTDATDANDANDANDATDLPHDDEPPIITMGYWEMKKEVHIYKN